MKGEQLIPLPQDETWQALNDPAILKECIPGCEAIERISDGEYMLTMLAKVGPVSARFKGRMTLTEVDAPRAYTLVFEGQGGAAGFAKGRASVVLSTEEPGTRLAYSASATVGGKLAQVGARLLGGVAKKLADQFFSAFNKRMSEKP